MPGLSANRPETIARSATIRVQGALLGLCGVTLCEVAGLGLTGGMQARQAPRPLQAARAAIGDARTLGGVNALRLEGTIRLMNLRTGQLMSPSPIEIRILMPDHYVRIDTLVGVVRHEGVAGDVLVHTWKAIDPATSQFVMPSAMPDQIKQERANQARLVLGLLAESAAALPLRARTSEASASAGAATATTLAFDGPDGFAAALDLDSASGAPWRVRFDDQVRFPRTDSAPQSGTVRTTAMPPPEKAEVTLTFEDRRPVGGLTLPHRITRTSRGLTFEEIQLDRILVNPPLGRQDFQP